MKREKEGRDIHLQKAFLFELGADPMQIFGVQVHQQG